MPAKKKISILSYTLEGNAVGRAYILAKLLEAEFDCTIIGNGSIDKVWYPISNDQSIKFKAFEVKSSLDFYLKRKTICKELIDGDLVLSCKPLQSSFSLGLYAAKSKRIPHLVDVDDYELGFISDSIYWEIRNFKTSWLTKLNSPLYTRLLTRKISKADAVIVSNAFLQDLYGGSIIPHARDENFIKATPLGHSDPLVVLFLGSPRPQKGLKTLFDAWKHQKPNNAILRIIGIQEKDLFIQKYNIKDLQSYEVIEEIEFEKLPTELAKASIIVIPQLSDRAGNGQLPAKLIDALASGRPIIGSDAGEIPKWLEADAGIVFPSGDHIALSECINRLARDNGMREKLAINARKRFLERASFQTIRVKLIRIVNDLFEA